MGLYNNIALFLSFENSFENNTKINLIGEIVSIPEESETTSKYIFEIINNDKNFNLKNKKIFIYISNEIKYKPGDIVFVNGIIENATEERNLKGFNYRMYLKSKKIYGIIKVEETYYIKTIKDFSYFIGRLQEKIYTCIDKIYNENYQSFISKLLFGANEKIEEKIKDNFKNSSLSHVLAISGMHISYIVLFVNLVLKYLIKNIKLRNIFLCIFLVFFIAFTGFSASCMRACIMNIVFFISKNIYRKNNVFISIIFSFIFLNFINIYTLFDIGMWLSFLGTLGILLFYKFLKLFIFSKSNKVLYQIQNIILVSVSAQILIWPVILYVFNTISLTFFISNILITPIIAPIIIIGYLSIFISIIFSPLGFLITKIEEILCFILYKIAEICSNLPFSNIYIKGSHEIFLIFYYLLIIIFIYYFSRNKWKVLKRIVIFKNCIKYYFNPIAIKYKLIKKNNKKYFYILKNMQNRKRIIKILIIIFIILIFIIIIFYTNQKELEIYFVDVGQGDCTIIKTQNKNIIIDGGEGNSENKYDYGKNVVLQHLLKLGINKIDYMIFSHFDSDHAGGLVYILENLEVEKVIFGIQVETSECLEDVLKISKEKQIEIIVLESGDRFKIDENSYIDVFWPNNEKLINENVLNNNSLIFKFIYKNFSMLFTGDIEEIAEKEIVKLNKGKLKSDILKVSHHGSKTSTIKSFLEEVSPKIALIGVGENNNFGHPNFNVIERLKEKGVKIFRTDEDGEIIIKLSKPEKENTLIIRKVIE